MAYTVTVGDRSLEFQDIDMVDIKKYGDVPRCITIKLKQDVCGNRSSDVIVMYGDDASGFVERFISLAREMYIL
jgi:hypothetical protein